MCPSSNLSPSTVYRPSLCERMLGIGHRERAGGNVCTYSAEMRHGFFCDLIRCCVTLPIPHTRSTTVLSCDLHRCIGMGAAFDVPFAFFGCMCLQELCLQELLANNRCKWGFFSFPFNERGWKTGRDSYVCLALLISRKLSLRRILTRRC